MVVLELLHLKMEVTVSEPCDVIRVETDMLLSKYDTLSRCCFNLGPESPILTLILLDPYIYGFTLTARGSTLVVRI